jgi:endonuclease/exonuclease/phosphatase family metal-dependent hydrolase
MLRSLTTKLIAPICAVGILLVAATPVGAAETLRVMTFNLWQGGEEGKQPLAQTIEVIKAAKADLVGLQETAGIERGGKKPDNARRIAEQLGWDYVDQGGGTGVISRFKITGHTEQKLGVRVGLPSGKAVWLFNVHFAHAPYQPYQLLKIPYADAPFIETAEQAVVEARKARGQQVKALLGETKKVSDGKTPVLITGDFNEPSLLDWTKSVVFEGGCPMAVRWPTTASVHDAGFVDAYREIHPDPVKRPGYTWTPITSEDDPKDRHDRIDFVFAGRGVKVTAAEVVGERADRAEIVVKPYPSDHRAVVATVSWDN